MGAGVVQGHFAQTVPQPDIGIAWRHALPPLAAPSHLQPGLGQQLGHSVKALGVARHDQPLVVAHLGQRLPLCQPLRLFTFTGAGQQHNRARSGCTPRCPQGQQGCIGLHIELQVAHDGRHGGAQAAQAFGVFLGLGQYGRQACIGRVGQGAPALRSGKRFGIQSRIGQHQGDACLAAAGHQVGPDLGFHQDAHQGPKLLQKALHRTGCIPGQPDLHIARLQQLGTLGTACGSAVRQEQSHAGQVGAQRLQQQGGGAGLAQGHGVDPNPLSSAIAS